MSDAEEKKINVMKYKIIALEKQNLKTHEKTNDQMVEAIRKIIRDESRKNY